MKAKAEQDNPDQRGDNLHARDFFQAAMKAEPCKCHPEIPWLRSALALLTTVNFSTGGGREMPFFLFTLSIKS